MTPTQKARYTLRNTDKIILAYGEEFFTEHIKGSLDEYFRNSTVDDVNEDATTTARVFGRYAYPVLAIDDIADASGDGKVEVCITGVDYNVFHLAFLQMAWF